MELGEALIDAQLQWTEPTPCPDFRVYRCAMYDLYARSVLIHVPSLQTVRFKVPVMVHDMAVPQNIVERWHARERDAAIERIWSRWEAL